MKLYQLSTTGKTKETEITTSGNKLIVVWGVIDGKKQKTTKVCEGKNIGKKNATAGAQQAILEMESLITRKKEAGYSELPPVAGSTISAPVLDLDNIPESFCPSKPISKAPDSVVSGKDTYAQRKHNGHCIILTKDSKGNAKVYSRRMEDRTKIALAIPEIKTEVMKLKPSSMALAEFFFTRKKDLKEIVRHIASVIRVSKPEVAKERYNDFNKEGYFSCKVFDILFQENKFLGELDYLDRYRCMQKLKLDIPAMINGDWKDMIDIAKANQWEGFVLRVVGKGQVTYTMNGKPDRKGSYKFKFMQEGDFIVTSAEYGTSGKHTKLLAKFYISAYLTDGTLVSCASVGPGRQSHPELEDLTRAIETGARKYPFVVEIEYPDQDEDTHALTHGQIVRIRDDKKIEECVLNE